MTLALAFLAVVGADDRLGVLAQHADLRRAVLRHGLRVGIGGGHQAEDAEGALHRSTTAGGRSGCRSTRVDELRLRARRRRACRPRAASASRSSIAPPFGVTEFLEHVNYRRALEGELARTISTIARSGQRPRAHRDGAAVAVRRSRPADQGVGGPEAARTSRSCRRRPSPPSPASWRPASSRCGRKRSSSSTTSAGRCRKPKTPDDAAGGVPLERQQRIERELSARVIASARADRRRRSRARERQRQAELGYQRRDRRELGSDAGHPQPAERHTDGERRPPAARRAWPAARANLPPDPIEAGEAGGGATSLATRPTGAAHTAETTNYEVSKRDAPQPSAARRRRAALGGGDPRRRAPSRERRPAAAGRREAARRAEEIQKIHGLVAAAVGLDADRGDQLTVENIAFEETAGRRAVAAPGAWQQYRAAGDRSRAACSASSRSGVLALFGVIRPIVKGSLAAGVPAAAMAKRGPVAAAPAGVGGAAHGSGSRSRDRRAAGQSSGAAADAGADQTRRGADAARTRERGPPAAHLADRRGALNMAVQVALSGARKAAILLLTLGEEPVERSASSTCTRKRSKRIAKELAALGTVPAGDRRARARRVQPAGVGERTTPTHGGVDYARASARRGARARRVAAHSRPRHHASSDRRPASRRSSAPTRSSCRSSSSPSIRRRSR